MEQIIRRAAIDDIPAMYAVSLGAHQASYNGLIPSSHRARFDARRTRTPENEARFHRRMTERLQNENWESWVAERDGKVVGYTLQERADAHLILKHGLFVDPKWHGHGIGTTLFETSLAAAKPGDTIRLSVVAGNARAKHIYLAHGFTVTGISSETYFGAPLEVMEWQKR